MPLSVHQVETFPPPERALLVREPYVSLLLTRRKRWELRGLPTKIRGRIGLIRSGSGLVVGECEIADCIGPLNLETLKRTSNLTNKERLEIATDGLPPYIHKDGVSSKTFAWVIERPIIYRTPLHYKHPSGAIIFVDLTKPGVLECSEASRSTGDLQPQLF
jgi:hypothetical protein